MDTLKHNQQTPKTRTKKAANSVVSYQTSLDNKALGILQGISIVISKTNYSASISVYLRRALEVYGNHIAKIRDDEEALQREIRELSHAAKGRSYDSVKEAEARVTGEKLPKKSGNMNLAIEGSWEPIFRNPK